MARCAAPLLSLCVATTGCGNFSGQPDQAPTPTTLLTAAELAAAEGGNVIQFPAISEGLPEVERYCKDILATQNEAPKIIHFKLPAESVFCTINTFPFTFESNNDHASQDALYHQACAVVPGKITEVAPDSAHRTTGVPACHIPEKSE